MLWNRARLGRDHSPKSQRIFATLPSSWSAFVLLSLLGARPAAAATFTVDSKNNSGAGTLRAAITSANGSPGADVITFNITGAGVHTINVNSALPAITETVVIDGTTQPGYT